MFFAPRPKIFLQQYLPKADSCAAAIGTLIDYLVGARQQ